MISRAQPETDYKSRFFALIVFLILIKLLPFDTYLSILISFLIIFLYPYFWFRVIFTTNAKAMKLMDQGKFEESIKLLKTSIFLNPKYEWMDRWRGYLFLYSTKYSLKEAILSNIAFAYGQLGKGKEAEEYYKKMLEVNPDNPLAKASIAMLNAKNN